MKTAGNRFIKDLRLFCLIGVIALALITIFSTGGCGGGGDSGDSGDGGGGDDNGEPTTMPGQATYINFNSNDSLFLTHIDDYNLMYSFFGVRDYNGALQYCDQLILNSLINNDTVEHYLTIDFDQYQRPIKLTLPNLGGDITLDYISDSEVGVTINAPDGTSETVFVDNPLPVPVSQNTLENEINVQEGFDPRTFERSSASALEETLEFSGDIDVCDVGAEPTVAIKRIIDPKYGSSFAQIIPRVRKWDDNSEWDYYYNFSISVPNTDFEAWEEACKWEMKFIAGTSLLGLPGTIIAVVNAVIEDAKKGTDDKTKKKLLDKLIGKITKFPIVTQIRIIGETLKAGGGLVDGPCSKEVWETLSEIHCVDQEITCTYGSQEKLVKFSPCWVSDPGHQPGDIYPAPNFDFSDTCCGNVTEAGSDAPETHTHELGQTKGQITFHYETYSIKDQIQVIYAGSIIFDTGCVGESGSQIIDFDGDAHELTVTVIPNCEGTTGTAWNYSFTCPQ